MNLKMFDVRFSFNANNKGGIGELWVQRNIIFIRYAWNFEKSSSVWTTENFRESILFFMGSVENVEIKAENKE